MTPSFVRGDEWFIGIARLEMDDNPVTNPENYTVSAVILWPGGSLDLNTGNGRISYGDGFWSFVLQEKDTTDVPLGRVARMVVSVIVPGDILVQASTPIEVRRN